MCDGRRGRRLKSPKGERAKKGPFRKKCKVDVGVTVPPLREDIVLGGEVLMHVLFYLPKTSENLRD